MRAIRTILAVAATIISLACSAQRFAIGLHGKVTDYFSGLPLRGAQVAVHGQGYADSARTRADGFYAFELQRGQFYTIVASLEGRITKRFCIQTDSVPLYPDVPFYDMDVQITLFEPIPGFNFSLFEQPLGISEYKQSVRNMSWDNDYTERVERLLLRPTMREYEKAWEGYYSRKSERLGEAFEPEVPSVDSVIGNSFASDEWSRPTILIIRDSLLGVDVDTLEYWDDPEDPVLATPVDSIDGLFFTVQVGVYAEEVSLLFEDQIPGIRPLNSERAGTNLVRYTTGRYSNVADAERRMEWCRSNGVPDAFVTAYWKGIRVSIQEALDLLAELGPSILIR